MELLWFCGGVGEPALFKLTVIQHPAKSHAHNSPTPPANMRGESYSNTYCTQGETLTGFDMMGNMKVKIYIDQAKDRPVTTPCSHVTE